MNDLFLLEEEKGEATHKHKLSVFFRDYKNKRDLYISTLKYISASYHFCVYGKI